MIKSFNKSFEQLSKSISQGYKRPSCEISQSKDYLTIKVKLPGMTKNDILLNITHDYLEIVAEKKGKKVRKTKRAYKREEEYLGYKRIIPLPPGLITDKVDAKFTQGRLTIKIPKVKIGKIKVK